MKILMCLCLLFFVSCDENNGNDKAIKSNEIEIKSEFDLKIEIDGRWELRMESGSAIVQISAYKNILLFDSQEYIGTFEGSKFESNTSSTKLVIEMATLNEIVGFFEFENNVSNFTGQRK